MVILKHVEEINTQHQGATGGAGRRAVRMMVIDKGDWRQKKTSTEESDLLIAHFSLG